MAQNIFYILTNHNAIVPIEIVHFKEGNGIIIPILIDKWMFEIIVDNFEEEDVLTKEDFLKSSFRHCPFEYPTKKVFNFIGASLDSFAIIGYYEEHGMSDNLGKPICFINTEKVDTSALSEIDVHKALDTTITFIDIIRNKNKYRDYYSAEKIYFKELQEKSSSNNI